MAIKSNKILTIILLIVGFAIFYVVFLPWIFLAFGAVLMPNPPSPKFTYGEFPFVLEYAINGERFVVEDTVICKYDGVGLDESQG